MSLGHQNNQQWTTTSTVLMCVCGGGSHFKPGNFTVDVRPGVLMIHSRLPAPFCFWETACGIILNKAFHLCLLSGFPFPKTLEWELQALQGIVYQWWVALISKLDYQHPAFSGVHSFFVVSLFIFVRDRPGTSTELLPQPWSYNFWSLQSFKTPFSFPMGCQRKGLLFMFKPVSQCEELRCHP